MSGSTICTHCGANNTAYAEAPMGHDSDERGPEEGDVTICWTCGNIGVFTGEGVNYVPMSAETLLGIKKVNVAFHDKLIELSEMVKSVKVPESGWE